MLQIQHLVGFGGRATGLIATDGSFAEANIAAYGFGASDGARYLGFKWTASASGGVSSVRIDIASVGSSGTFSAKIYSDSAGSPGAQIGGDSDSLAISATGEKTFTFPGEPPVAAGTDYWVVIGETTAGSASVTAQTCAQQAANTSGRHNTITSISSAQVPEADNRDWRVEIKIFG